LLSVGAKKMAMSAGGVIVLFEGDVQSWINTLRNPEHWQR